ncbi:hypothetical protein DM02DRAFT_513303 [Periconia macrospinosa]|uniref:FAD/NAD(P)-binding domain-containing protein n=1 Tax=Periconia macrospinosa TaxID=97972 RepID=A0A2V1ECZ5_9PLEO|nr:hypothetical protein DM02DRAFT_513303 [Periconia macrospinosa]
MTIEPLSSNVLNYLVWRYLQEAGYGNAALHLSRCWNRDPEALPFAPNVQPHTLVNLLQDGLWFDKLQAEAGNCEQRYRFGRDHGRPYSVRNGSLLTLDQGIPAHVLAEQANGDGAVQEPPPKRGVKKKSKPKANGVVEPRVAELVNGDAMELDQNGATHVTNSVRAESEAVASETESPTVAEIPISTLSIGQSTEIQTEVIANLTPNTTFIPGLKHIEKAVEHTSWGPAEAPVLLTAGKSLLNINVISKDAGKNSVPAVNTVSLKLPMNNYSITALSWNSSTEVTVSAREECSNETGEKMMIDKLIQIMDGGDDYRVISSTAGLVNTLRWNKEKELLLSISTDGERGSIKIWKNSNDSIPAWTDFTDTAIFDALWISDTAFVVCGISLFKIYEIGDTLTTQRTLDTQVTWETLKYEPSSGIIAALGIENQSSYLGILHPNDSLNLQKHEYPDEYPTDLDFRISTENTTFSDAPFGKSPSPPVLLATCSMSGVVRIWDANSPFKSVRRLPTTDDSQAFKSCFSPDGSLLAAAGPDAVTVWDVEKREVPIASWRAREWGNDKWDPSVDGEFSLGWDPDGSRMSIALGNQVGLYTRFLDSLIRECLQLYYRLPSFPYRGSCAPNCIRQVIQQPSKKNSCRTGQTIQLSTYTTLLQYIPPVHLLPATLSPLTMSAIPNIPTDTPLVSTNGIPNGTTTTNGVPNGTITTPVKLHDHPIDNARPIKVIVIGAGYSGIYMGIRIPEKLCNVELVIYEKNAGVGGTWYENRLCLRYSLYVVPFLASAHSYQYSFEPNPNWSSLYAPAPEIQAYLEFVTKKYSVGRFIKLSHQITECRWDDATAKWHVSVKNLTTGETINDTSDVLISARGGLNTPAWPQIDGLSTFKGEVMHSATWNQSYDWENKRVGVIGSGSSSIQIVPSLQRLPGTHVSTFVRSKTWVSPSIGQELWDQYGFKGFSIPKDLQQRFIDEPEYYHKFRTAVEEDGNGVHALTIKGTPMQEGAKEAFTAHMKKRLESVPHIYDALLPKFSPGCRRLTPGPGYLEALTQPNVAFITSPITRISENAVHTADGVTHEIDALVCATGFHNSTAPPFPLIGASGLSLADKWSKRATNYMSHSLSGFPNLFSMLGPNSGVGSGSLTMMIETVADYGIKMIRKIQKENIAKMEVKREREEDFLEVVDAYFKGTVFGEECRSWYKNKHTGEITGLWPGSCLHCIEAMRSPRWEDFDYVYVDELEGGTKKRANRMLWLGNGWTQNGIDRKHLAWYLEDGYVDRPEAPLPEAKERYHIRPFSY